MLIFILLCLSIQGAASTQKAIDHKKLKLQAQELCDATLKGDFGRAADLTYPKLIQLMGGRTQYLAVLEKGMKETQSAQFQISSMTVGEPRDIFKFNTQHYAIVPTIMRMKVPQGTLVGEGFMIGISADGGQNWTFVDSGPAAQDKQKLRILFGPAAEELRLPDEKRPVLYPGQEQ